tara:strand:- start:1116 stop:1592 length:477 start_codon:yes stop_codon:yes gene_type:complete
MSVSLENGGTYEFRNQAGDSTPRGLSNFPNWFTPLVGSGGKPNVRPADLDMTLQHRPYGSQQWEGAIICEFKPAGTGPLGYAQSGILEWCGRMPNSFGIHIEDNEWDLRTKSRYDEEMMQEHYRVTFYKEGKTMVQWMSLQGIYNFIEAWWTNTLVTN